MSKERCNPSEYSASCRICLKTPGTRQLMSLFKIKDKQMPSLILAKVGTVEVQEGDNLPQFCCNQCWKKILTSFLLTQKIQETDKYLRSQIIDTTLVKTELMEEMMDIKPELVFTENLIDNDKDIVSTEDFQLKQETPEEKPTKTEKTKKAVTTEPRCCMCRFTCKNEEALVSHVKANHPDPVNKSKTQFKPIQCRYCFKGFSNNRTYVDHFRKPYIDRIHQCSLCGQTFAYISDLLQHELTHQETKEVICEVCKKSFRSEKNLRRHMKVHDDSNKLQCDLCSRLFAEKKQLEYHMKSHINVRDCICAVCGRGFVHNSLLKLHMRKHTGERPHKCSICDKAYKHNTDLRRHKYEHEGIKPFKCSFCDRTFYQRSNMKVHERVHTGHCPFACNLCGQKFKFHAHWKSHEKKHHGVGQPAFHGWLA